MAEAYSTDNMEEAAVQADIIVIEKIGEAAENTAVAAEAISEEATVGVAIMIMATTVI